MAWLDFFKPVSTWSTDRVRNFIRDHRAGDYNLVDVRQPQEYEEEHLPGALLIPLDELPDRLSELDESKPTIAY